MKSPYAVLVMLLIPIITTAIMGAVFSPGENKLPKIKILLADNDKNIASRFFMGAFNSEQMKDMFSVTTVEETEGRILIGKGKASALVIIPKNFSVDLLEVKETSIEVVKNPSEQFLPNVVEELMGIFTTMISGLVQSFEPELKMIRQMKDMDLKNVSMLELAPYMEKSKEKIVAMQSYLDPLLLKVKEEITHKKKKEDAGFNIFAEILPGISILFLLFIVEIFIRDILTEREDGKLQRIMFSPIRSVEFISARIISGWLLGIISYALLVVVGSLLFGISWGNYLILFLFIAVICFWIAAFFALLNSFFKNKNQAGAVTAPVILVFGMFGGSMIPASQLPKMFKMFSAWTPIYWMIEGIKAIHKGNFPAGSFLVLGLTGAALFFLAVTLLKKRITT